MIVPANTIMIEIGFASSYMPSPKRLDRNDFLTMIFFIFQILALWTIYNAFLFHAYMAMNVIAAPK